MYSISVEINCKIACESDGMNHILKHIKKTVSDLKPRRQKLVKIFKKSARPPTFWQKLRTLTNYFLCGLT